MKLSRAGWVVMMFLSVAVVVVSARYLAFDPEAYFEQQREVYLRRETVLGLHVGGAMVALAIGPFQFLRALRRRPRLHRALGRLYVTGVLIGGTAGLALATTAHGGLVATLGFMGLGVAWLVTTLTALRLILAGRVVAHRRWMIRGFALTFAAVTLRVYLGVAAAVGADFDTAYVTIAWLCWVPNLLIAVLMTRPAHQGAPRRSTMLPEASLKQ